MNNRIIYNPLTATPFKRNIAYIELNPCKELHSYIRCYWGTENPLIQIENNDAPELVIALAKCVMVAICVRDENCGDVVMCLVRYGLIPETLNFQMKNLMKM